jgi:hypothetical protein
MRGNNNARAGAHRTRIRSPAALHELPDVPEPLH